MGNYIKQLKESNGTALLMTLLILTSILVVVLGAANLIVPGIKMSRTQAQSTKAFFASEAGIEKALWELRKNDYVVPAVDTENVFSDVLGNNSLYQVDYSVVDTNVTFISTGRYQQTRRSVAVNFEVSGGYGGCVANCVGKSCGDDDGCGAPCPSTCLSSPGCRETAPANSAVAAGSCCTGSCYECAPNYFWDGVGCAEIFFNAATLDGLSWTDIKAYIDVKFQ